MASVLSGEDVLLIGLASCLGNYSLTTGRFTKIAATPGVARTRINDGRCDRMGNFVFITMCAGEPMQSLGRFHRVNAATLETETLNLPEVVIPNSICFSPDGSTMYYADSLLRCIFCCDYPSLEKSVCSRQSTVRALQTALVSMLRGFSGMRNGAVAEWCVTRTTEKLTM